jgi:hypothetical protein
MRPAGWFKGRPKSSHEEKCLVPNTDKKGEEKLFVDNRNDAGTPAAIKSPHGETRQRRRSATAGSGVENSRF